MEDKKPLILHSQYHGCWWPGDARSQGISNNSIDIVMPKYSWHRLIFHMGIPISVRQQLYIGSPPGIFLKELNQLFMCLDWNFTEVFFKGFKKAGHVSSADRELGYANGISRCSLITGPRLGRWSAHAPWRRMHAASDQGPAVYTVGISRFPIGTSSHAKDLGKWIDAEQATNQRRAEQAASDHQD